MMIKEKDDTKMKKSCYFILLTMIFLVSFIKVFKPIETLAASEEPEVKPGGYAIKSMANLSYGWDIISGIPASGLQRPTRIVTYPYSTQINQKWFIIYKANDEGYIILNNQDRGIIAGLGAGSSQYLAYPKNYVPFYQNYEDSKIYRFKVIDHDTDGNPIVLINVKSQDKYSYYARHTSFANDVGDTRVYEASTKKLSEEQVTGLENNDQAVIKTISNTFKWKLEMFSELPAPTITELKVKSPNNNSTHYVGEKFNVKGSMTSKEFYYYDLYSQFGDDSEPSVIESHTALNRNGTTTFDFNFDTSNYIEGTHPISFFARADSVFKSNVVDTPEKYTFIYPTPSGKPVLGKKIPLNTNVSTLKPADFVKDLSDEMGNSITAEKIEGLDTSVYGEQVARVTIKNRYKSTVIDVPVIIGDLPTLAWDETGDKKPKSEEVSASKTKIDVSLVWKPSYIGEKYYIIVKNGNTKIATVETKTATVQGSWIKEQIEIPLDSLVLGENKLTLEMYYTPNDTGNLFGSLTLNLTKKGILELLSVPDELNWTNINIVNSKGLIPRDTNNSIEVKVADSRKQNERNKNWSLGVIAKLKNGETAPFDLQWKENDASSSLSLVNKQTILTANKFTETNAVNTDTYERTFKNTEGILIDSKNYLPVGNYDNIYSVLWQLYDTETPG